MNASSRLPITLTKIGKNQKRATIQLPKVLENRGWELWPETTDAIVNHRLANHNAPDGSFKPAVITAKPSGLFCSYNPFTQHRRYFVDIEDAAEYASERGS